MDNIITSNKTIAKNSITLFLRTFITIWLSLYTSRIVLLQLGEDNFGIFSVVGGIAVLFSFLSNSISEATLRYFNISLGHNDSKEYQQTFSTSLNCYFIISIILIILSETIGLYIVNNVLNIAPDRMHAANYVFQFATISFIFGLINVPYSASIRAHEKFSYYAYMDVITKGLKLAIVFITAISPGDSLIIYSFLFMMVSVIRFISDKIYCRIKFQDCRYIRLGNLKLGKSMMKFSSLSLIRTTAGVGVGQGNNILVNIFGGTVASASVGLANQTGALFNSFFLNIQSVFDPQITKCWSTNNIQRFNALILNSSKFACYVIIYICIPLMTHTHFFLSFWLGTVPDYAVQFCIAAMISCYIAALLNPVYTAILTIGKIKTYQIMNSIIIILCLPIAFISLKMGIAIIGVYIIKIITEVIGMLYSIVFLSKISNFKKKSYLTTSVVNTIAFAACVAVSHFVNSLFSSAILGVMFSILTGWLFFTNFVWFYGLSNNQRTTIILYTKQKIRL